MQLTLPIDHVGSAPADTAAADTLLFHEPRLQVEELPRRDRRADQRRQHEQIAAS